MQVAESVCREFAKAICCSLVRAVTKSSFILTLLHRTTAPALSLLFLTPASTQDATGDDLDDTVDERPTGGGLFGPNPQA